MAHTKIRWTVRRAPWRAVVGALARHWLLLCAALLVASPSHGLEITALTEALPPLNYEADGKVTGFSSELLDLMAAETRITVRKMLLPWSRAYERTTREKDTLIYSLVRTPEREALFQWVGPISPRRILLYKLRDRSDIALKSLDDARAYRIGSTIESAATKNLMAQGFTVTNPQQPMGPGLDLGLHDQMNLKKLLARRFDLLVSLDWAAEFNSLAEGMAPDELQPAWILDESASYWFGVNLQTDPELVRRLNAALQKIKHDGRYHQLRLKYQIKTPK